MNPENQSEEMREIKSGVQVANPAKPDASNPKPEISGAVSGEDSKSATAKRNRELAESEGLRRKMTYIILFETIFILIAVGMNVYSVLKIFNLSKKIKEANINLNETANKNQNLDQTLTLITRDREKIANERDQWKADYNLLKSDADGLKTESEKIQAELSKSVSENQALVLSKTEIEKQLKNTQEQMEELRTKLGAANDEKIAVLRQECDRLAKELVEIRNAITPKKVVFNKQYEEYLIQATKVIETLKNFQDTLTKGVDNRKFMRDFDQVKFAMDEFRMNTTAYSNLLSFRLIISSFDAYQDSDDCWKKISQANLPKEAGIFRDAVVKFEKQITEYRPWVDAIQINWQMAQCYLTTAEYIIQNHDDVDAIHCPICSDKYSIACPKCSSSGECYLCKGRGQTENSICFCCEGLGKCPFCKGKKEIPCPIHIHIPK